MCQPALVRVSRGSSSDTWNGASTSARQVRLRNAPGLAAWSRVSARAGRRSGGRQWKRALARMVSNWPVKAAASPTTQSSSPEMSDLLEMIGVGAVCPLGPANLDRYHESGRSRWRSARCRPPSPDIPAVPRRWRCPRSHTPHPARARETAQPPPKPPPPAAPPDVPRHPAVRHPLDQRPTPVEPLEVNHAPSLTWPGLQPALTSQNAAESSRK